jgi:mono/diheme cytochrome c family protein
MRDNLTRENVMRQAANLKDVDLGMLLPGIRVNTGPADYFPLEELQIAAVQTGRAGRTSVRSSAGKSAAEGECATCHVNRRASGDHGGRECS